jgi:hypothetical protein
MFWLYTLHGKLDTHNTYAFMTSRTRQTFTLTQQGWTESLHSRKRTSDNIYPHHTGWPIHGSPPSFSLTHNYRSDGESQTSIDEHATLVYWAHISNMWSIRLILAHEYQPLGPWPTLTRATTMEVPTFYITLPPFPTDGHLFSTNGLV